MAEKKYNYIRKTFSFDGVRYEVTGKTEEEVIAKKLEKLAALEAGRVDSSTTVRQWAAVWYDTYVAHRKITEKSKRIGASTDPKRGSSTLECFLEKKSKKQGLLSGPAFC